MSTQRFAWITELTRPSPVSIALLFATTTVVRALLITLVPLRAMSHLGDAQSVSVLYFSVSLGAVIGTLCIPTIVHLIGRRWVFLVGLAIQIVCTPMLASSSTYWFVAGLAIQVIGIAGADLCLNLYVLELVPRRELAKFEPMRLFYAGLGWTVGPWLGVFLWEFANWLPYLLSAALAVIVATHFKILGLVDGPPRRARSKGIVNPIRYLPRFFGQPRLRLAFSLAFARSSWWTVFYIYAPIYLVASGSEPSTSAAVVSAANGGIFLVRVWGRIGQRFGIRRLLAVGFGLTCVTTLLVSIVPSEPYLVAATLLVAAFAASVVDGAGNVPFLRAVRPLERAEMTAVFATYRDSSQLIPPACFSLLLRFIELYAVFAVSAAALLVMLPFIRHIPRRL